MKRALSIRTPLFWILTLFPFAWESALVAAGSSGAMKRPPNIVLFLTDDQGYGDLGFLGNPVLRTPQIDAFAKDSAVFSRFYVSPVCSPTRASLLTGRYHLRTGVVDTGDGRSNLRSDELTLAEYLRRGGYRTAIYGKWHLGENFPGRPMDQGFDESLVIAGGMIGATYNPLGGNSYFDPILLHNGRERHHRGYITDILAGEAMEFMTENRDRPFFLYFAANTPHHPLTAPEADIQPYRAQGLSDETARFYGMIANLDRNFGLLLRRLNEIDRTRDTIVIYMTDNGTSSLLVEKDRHESGLRGRKATLYENGIRVPFCLRWPGQTRPGTTIDTLAAHIDVLPTLLDACGLTIDPSRPVDGVSLREALGSTPAVRAATDRRIFLQWHRGDQPQLFRSVAVVTQRYKLVQAAGRDVDPGFASYRFELFDLASDPRELTDLAQAHPDIVATLKSDYEQWFRTIAGTNLSREGAMQVDLPVARVGTRHENPVTLTRQDWRGAKEWFDDHVGGWAFDVSHAGDYEITLSFTDILLADGKVHMSLNGAPYTTTMTKGETAVRWSPVQLASGRVRLEGRLELPGRVQGVRFATIRRLDLPDSVVALRIP